VNELIDGRLKLLTAHLSDLEVSMKKKGMGNSDDLQAALIDSKIDTGQKEILTKMTIFVEKLDEDMKQKRVEIASMN